MKKYSLGCRYFKNVRLTNLFRKKWTTKNQDNSKIKIWKKFVSIFMVFSYIFHK